MFQFCFKASYVILVVLNLAGTGLIFTGSQAGWPKLPNQMGYSIPCDGI